MCYLHGPCNLIRKDISFTKQLKGIQAPDADLAMSLWSSCLCCWSSVAIACCACCCIVCTKCCMCWKASICNGMMVAVRTTGVKYNFTRQENNVEINFHWKQKIHLVSFQSFLAIYILLKPVYTLCMQHQVNEEVRDSRRLRNLATELLHWGAKNCLIPMLGSHSCHTHSQKQAWP